MSVLLIESSPKWQPNQEKNGALQELLIGQKKMH